MLRIYIFLSLFLVINIIAVVNNVVIVIVDVVFVVGISSNGIIDKNVGSNYTKKDVIGGDVEIQIEEEEEDIVVAAVDGQCKDTVFKHTKGDGDDDGAGGACDGLIVE